MLSFGIISESQVSEYPFFWKQAAAGTLLCPGSQQLKGLDTTLYAPFLTHLIVSETQLAY